MYVYIFEYIEELTDNWHSDGGLVVIAKSRKQAKELIASKPSMVVTDEEWDSCIVHKLVGNPKPQIFVFPDAGCC